MPELYESSGLHSLAALRAHEQERARAQVEAARARAEAEQAARLEREATRREQERQSAERAARESAESAERAAQLRAEITEHAEAERRSALSRSAEELQLNLNLERQARRSAELELTARLLRQRLLTSVAWALCSVTALGALALYVGVLKPSAERVLAAAQQALLVEQRARGEAEANVQRAVRRTTELSLRVDTLEQRLREAQVTPPATLSPQAQKPGRHGPVKVPLDPCREDGDPLNPCLRR